MNWVTMKTVEPELAKLEASARFAGENQASWVDVLFATNESLTKCVGRGSYHEELQDGRAYEVARAAIYSAWARGAKDSGRITKIGNPPRPRSQPKPAVCQPVEIQHEMFDMGEAYR